jgi:hypothetical protein
MLLVYGFGAVYGLAVGWLVKLPLDCHITALLLRGMYSL